MRTKMIWKVMRKGEDIYMNMESFGKKISSMRQNANMTQEGLALRMGVTPQAVSKWERGQSLPDISIFTELCRALNASADLLLGLGEKDSREMNDNEILKNLRCSLAPLALLFGKDLVRTFLDSPYAELIFEQRRKLSWEGILLPVITLRDELRLEADEYVITAYDRVLYREKVEAINGDTLEHIIQTLGHVVKENYGKLLSRDLVKSLVDNLKLQYPVLIEGVVPEKISYGLLQEVLKIFLSKGNSPMYLPKVIESLESALYRNPDASVEQLAEQVCADLETSDNIQNIIHNSPHLS